MNTLKVITDDTAIKAMLLRQQIPMRKPEPPNDVVFAKFTDGGDFWIAMRFYQTGDEGYVAMGIPEDAPDAEREDMVRLILGHFTETAKAHGMNAWADSTYTEVKPVESN